MGRMSLKTSTVNANPPPKGKGKEGSGQGTQNGQAVLNSVMNTKVNEQSPPVTTLVGSGQIGSSSAGKYPSLPPNG